MYSTMFMFIYVYLAHFSFLTNIGGFKNICTKLQKGINSLYQRIDFFSLTVHIIKQIENSEGEFSILNIKLNSFNQN